jgi:hypothetical protein
MIRPGAKVQAPAISSAPNENRDHRIALRCFGTQSQCATSTADGVLLAALAAQFVIDGVRAVIAGS